MNGPVQIDFGVDYGRFRGQTRHRQHVPGKSDDESCTGRLLQFPNSQLPAVQDAGLPAESDHGVFERPVGHVERGTHQSYVTHTDKQKYVNT